MRSALFIHDDESLLNRIKITIHDDNAQYFFAQSIDDAIEIMDRNEIAVVFMPYNFDVLDGNEMIEIILDHNPKVQIITLFKDSDLQNIVKSHNNYHLCQIICEDFFKIEDLQSLIELGFKAYNKEEDVKAFELDYRKKEDKYKKTIVNMSSLLNDRTKSFDLIKDTLKATITLACDDFAEGDLSKINAYFDRIYDTYINLYLVKNSSIEDNLKSIYDYNNPEQNHYLKVDFDNFEIIKAEDIETQNNVSFILFCITSFINDFYSKYKGKIELSDQGKYYSLNVVYDAIPNKDTNLPVDKIQTVLEHILSVFSDRVAYAIKDRIVQYKLMIKKNLT